MMSARTKVAVILAQFNGSTEEAKRYIVDNVKGSLKPYMVEAALLGYDQMLRDEKANIRGSNSERFVSGRVLKFSAPPRVRALSAREERIQKSISTEDHDWKIVCSYPVQFIDKPMSDVTFDDLEEVKERFDKLIGTMTGSRAFINEVQKLIPGRGKTKLPRSRAKEIAALILNHQARE